MSWMRFAQAYEEYKTLIRVLFFVVVLLAVLMGGLLVNTAHKSVKDHEEIRIIRQEPVKPGPAAPPPGAGAPAPTPGSAQPESPKP